MSPFVCQFFSTGAAGGLSQTLYWPGLCPVPTSKRIPSKGNRTALLGPDESIELKLVLSWEAMTPVLIPDTIINLLAYKTTLNTISF